MIRYFLFSLFCIQSTSQLNFCLNGQASSQQVIDYCRNHSGSLESRCCYQQNSKNVLAMDLTAMNLMEIPSLIEYENITLIDLRLNSQLKPLEKLDFLGLKSLDDLYLPEQYPCPGGKRVWENIEYVNDTKGIRCEHQKNVCTNSTALCPRSTSSCVPNGPTHFLCLCKSGYYGYKCLREGQFPMGKVLGIALLVTIVLSTFFYFTHRRNVKKD